MKSHKYTTVLACSLFAWSLHASGGRAPQLKVTLEVTRFADIAFLPISVRTTLTNTGRSDLTLMTQAEYYKAITFEVEGGVKYPCGGGGNEEGEFFLVPLKRLAPQESITISYGRLTRGHHVLAPGKYRVRAIYDSRPVAEYVKHTIYASSDWVEFELKAPEGVDAEYMHAYEEKYSAKLGDSLRCNTSYGDPELMEKYPGSIYAATRLLYGHFVSGENIWSPAKEFMLIKKGRHPSSNPYPTSEKRLPMSREEYFRWYINWSKAFLSAHPESKWVPYVRRELAIHHFALGEIGEYEKQLQLVIGSKDARESAWASEFMRLDRAERSRQADPASSAKP